MQELWREHGQPSLALPPPWVVPEGACVVFVLSTLLRGVPFLLLAAARWSASTDQESNSASARRLGASQAEAGGGRALTRSIEVGIGGRAGRRRELFLELRGWQGRCMRIRAGKGQTDKTGQPWRGCSEEPWPLICTPCTSAVMSLNMTSPASSGAHAHPCMCGSQVHTYQQTIVHVRHKGGFRKGEPGGRHRRV